MKVSSWIRGILLILCLGIALFSGSRLYGIYREYDTGNDSYEDLSDRYVARVPSQTTETKEIPEEADTEPEGTSQSSETESPEPAEEAPITVDFAQLLSENPDVAGWLYCEDTPINYPVMQGPDNDKYLYRLLDGTSNANGSIFMDFRNASDFSDWNSILYGHHMQSGAMFGTIQRYRNQSYYEAHPVFYLLTPEKNYKVLLIAGYTTWDSAEETYGIAGDLEERNVLLENALERNDFQTDVYIEDTDRLLTMSTCAYEFENARYVLVGVLRPLDGEWEGGRDDA